MTLQWIPLIVLLVVNFALDLWLYRKFRRSERWPRLRSGVHAVISLVLLGLIVAVMSIPRKECDGSTFLWVMWMLYLYYAFYVPRYMAALVWVPTHLKRSGERTRRWGGIIATIVGVVVFIFMLSGLFYTPYKLEVKHLELEFENLPEEFDGYCIAQFSDTHLGTYGGNTKFIAECVDSINVNKPDLICFTGDLVSRETSEALPYKKDLSKLHAPDGVISILGNHDDTHYKNWPTQQQRDADFKALIDLQREMGWKLLINDHIILRRDSAEIAVVGTKSFQGWPFPRYAYLDTAYADYDKSKRFMILLQHNPEQWKLDSFYQRRITMVRPADKADLMLSGHTHAMQCMITLFGHKITPASLFNDYAVGLYTEGDHKLYTNIGIGLVGIPARLGTAYPEITIITLKKRGPCIVNQNGWKIAD